jgi:hypothetical protein
MSSSRSYEGSFSWRVLCFVKNNSKLFLLFPYIDVRTLLQWFAARYWYDQSVIGRVCVLSLGVIELADSVKSWREMTIKFRPKFNIKRHPGLYLQCIISINDCMLFCLKCVTLTVTFSAPVHPQWFHKSVCDLSYDEHFLYMHRLGAGQGEHCWTPLSTTTYWTWQLLTLWLLLSALGSMLSMTPLGRSGSSGPSFASSSASCKASAHI